MKPKIKPITNKEIAVWTYDEPVMRILKDHYNELALMSNKLFFKNHKPVKKTPKLLATWKSQCTRIHKKYNKKLKEAVEWKKQWDGLNANWTTVKYTYDNGKITKSEPKKKKSTHKKSI